MKIVRGLSNARPSDRGCVLTIGNFDGMHLGHRMVLETAQRESQKLAATAVALTFDPHPATVLRPDSVPGLLTPTPFKLRLMERMGFTHALVLASMIRPRATRKATAAQRMVEQWLTIG